MTLAGRVAKYCWKAHKLRAKSKHISQALVCEMAKQTMSLLDKGILNVWQTAFARLA